MRAIFKFWFLPMAFFWGWYTLASNDWSGGMYFFSRGMYDEVFGTYSSILGIEESTIVWLVIRACIVDTILIFAIYGFRKRREIMAWWRARRAVGHAVQPSAPPAE